MTIDHQKNLEKIIKAVIAKHPKCKENGITFIEVLNVMSGYPEFKSKGKIIAEGEIILIKFPDQDIYWNPKIKLEEQEEAVINALGAFVPDEPKKMMIYEFITPSDPITFLANDDKIAFACAIILGRGRAGCNRYDEEGKEINLQSMCMFAPDPFYHINATLKRELNDFIAENKQAIAEAFKTFSYGNITERIAYNEALAAIADPEKLKEFKAKHEDRNRSSMSQWVKSAWKIADNLLQQAHDHQ